MRLGVLSFWHVHADDYTRQAAAHPDAEVVALWDEQAERGGRKSVQWDVPLIGALDDLLAREDIDAVVVTGPTTTHREVITRAAAAGKHVFAEKLLAPTVLECADIVSAVERAGVKLMVSLPHLTYGYALAIQALLAQGELGALTAVRIRRSHNGAAPGELPDHFFRRDEAAGGALFDLGCHPMYLARRFLGMPSTVSAHCGHVTGRELEDNAVAILAYPQGAMAVVETAFVEDASFSGVELHGTEGAVVLNSADGRLLVRSAAVGGPRTWRPRPIPPDLPPPLHQWIDHIQSDRPTTENVHLAVELTRLMEASDRSARSGRAVALSEIGG